LTISGNDAAAGMIEQKLGEFGSRASGFIAF
jgi:hypothetical protein